MCTIGLEKRLKMDQSNLTRIQKIKTFARQQMHNPELAHDFKHAERVTRNALVIAQGEQYPHSDRVQAAALLHDIALNQVKKRSEHGHMGAQVAERFLRDHELFSAEAILEIVHAIRWHDSIKAVDSQLLAILRDADMLDMFGAIGLMRAFTSKALLADYDPSHVKGETSGLSARDFDRRFVNGLGIGPTIMDQINFQMSCYDNLNTETARHIASPLIAFMRTFVEQFTTEVANPFMSGSAIESDP